MAAEELLLPPLREAAELATGDRHGVAVVDG